MPPEAVYLSDGWFRILEEEAQAAIDRAGEAGARATASLLERYRDGPAGWGGNGLLPGFRIEFRKGRASVRGGAEAAETADIVLEMSWRSAHRVVAQKSGPGLDALLQSLIDSGDLHMAGDLSKLPVDVALFHDAVSARTIVKTPA